MADRTTQQEQQQQQQQPKIRLMFSPFIAELIEQGATRRSLDPEDYLLELVSEDLNQKPKNEKRADMP